MYNESTMVILCIFIVIFLLLLAVTAMYPPRPTLSHFELQRRADNGDKEADLALDRLDLRADIITFLRIIEVLLLVVTVLLSIVAFGWLVGTIIAVVVALEYAAVARLQPVKALSQKLYDKIEPTIIDVVDTLHVPLRFVRGYIEEAHPRLVGSREELLHVIHESKGVLGTDETRLITHALAFGDLTVSKVMTPRSMIDTISQEELLGPLVLSDLHATGHTRIPVIEGDIDHVVGTLYLQDLLIVAGSKTKKASHAMEPIVFYIHEEQTLSHALAAFLKTHHHLFIVVNQYRETVGLLTLEDVIEALIGRKIIDEFDTHEDLRVVAARHPRANEKAAGREDV